MAANVRIAFVGGRGVDSRYGGVENAICQLASRMAAYPRTEIWVTGRGRGLGFRRQRFGDVHALQAPKVVGKLGHAICTAILLLHLMLVVRPQVVLLFASGPCVFSGLLRLCGVRVIACLRAIDSQRDGWRGPARWILRAGEYAALNHADLCTVNSLAMQRYFAGRGAETVYIPNGITPLLADRVGYLDTMGLAANGYLLYAGRLDPVKRLDVLLRAHAGLPKALRMPLVVAGDKCKSAEYKRQLEQLAGTEVIFLGHVDQGTLSTLMRHCALFILPSVLEGMSNSLLSAMGAGRCVLCADVEENADVVAADRRYLFEADNVADLQRQLTHYLTDPVKREAAGQALLLIGASLDWTHSTARFYQLACNVESICPISN
ncbi:glycosyltransferase family 4 protein [Ferrimonas pelagia]|uniref:Glycosyltransferase family 4 protein n=1 Tax=Ferrimonas pelagia TaxID=1177826 RepID=A0ABP9F0T5_9GAMM